MEDPGQATSDVLFAARVHRATIDAYGQFVIRTGGRVVERGGLTCVVGTDPSPIIINTAVRTGPTLAPGAVFSGSRAFYASIGHGFTLLTSDWRDADLNAAAAANGWQLVIELPVMVCLAPLPGRPLPEGATVRRADPTIDLASFRAVVRDGFAESDEEIDAVESVFARPAALAAPDTAAFIAAADGLDVAAAMVLALDGTGIVGWVGTLPAFRRRGLGAAVTRAATNAAFELGATLVTLQASPMGLPLYSKMGFKTISTDRVWLPPVV
jgi:GNAT superfamily N-acetyltransferase